MHIESRNEMSTTTDAPASHETVNVGVERGVNLLLKPVTAISVAPHGTGQIRVDALTEGLRITELTKALEIFDFNKCGRPSALIFHALIARPYFVCLTYRRCLLVGLIAASCVPRRHSVSIDV